MPLRTYLLSIIKQKRQKRILTFAAGSIGINTIGVDVRSLEFCSKFIALAYGAYYVISHQLLPLSVKINHYYYPY
jgi:hypothetical protein